MSDDEHRQNPTPGELGAKQELALNMLLEGRGVAEVAAKIGVHRGTLWEWSRGPAWIAERDRRRAEAREAAQASLWTLAGSGRDAVKVLLDVAVDERQPPAPRVQAAKAVIDILRGLLADDLEDRVTALEVAVLGGGR